MGLMNMSFLEIAKAVGINAGKGLYHTGKYIGKDIGIEALGLGSLIKDFSKTFYKYFKNTSSKMFETIDRKEANGIFQAIFGKKMRTGHVGETGTIKNIRDLKLINLGDTFKDGSKVGFIPKVGAGIVNGAYSGIANLPFGLVNNVALSPGGRLAVGIGAVGLGVGAFKGGQANSMANAEASELANMVSSARSPLLNSEEAIEKIDMGMKDHGAKGNLVFALHNLRQG